MADHPTSKPLGVTGPLSNALPTEEELKSSDDLIEELKSQNNYESAVDTEKRQMVLTSLQTITEEFVKEVSRAQGLADVVINSAGGKIFTYGSFRLGVYGPGSDIDTLVVVPKHIYRQDFFKYYPDILVRMAPPGAITDLTPVEEAFVPIIKFEYSDISIDLIFARIDSMSSIPRSLLSLANNDLLRGLDETELRSLNGTRVTDEIIALVPQPAVFRTALRGIKLWAQRRAIYANIMGFPGGVAWAMLVARVCQLYPKATSSTIMLKFFRIMEKWPWPQPVLLKKIEDGPLDVRVWNPRIYYNDGLHIMPIITPAYPSMCATHNVTYSTMEVINRELQRGGIITDQIKRNKAQWKDLFAKHTFFTQGYKYYLSIISASTTKEAQLHWSGTVESKVRHLVGGTERHDAIALAHPFNKGFERVHKCANEKEVDKVKGGSLEYQIKEIPTETTDAKNLGLDGAVDKKEDGVTNGESKSSKDGTTIVYTTTYYVGLELAEGAKSLDLSEPVGEFKTLCTRWETYDPELMALNVIHTRNCDLPDDVFAEGEVKPMRASKKKPVKNGSGKVAPNNKRASNDETVPAAKRQQT